MNVTNGDKNIIISLSGNGESVRNLSYGQPWTIEIHNTTTGELMATIISSLTTTIPTSG